MFNMNLDELKEAHDLNEADRGHRELVAGLPQELKR
jgi:hypothetical protein